MNLQSINGDYLIKLKKAVLSVFPKVDKSRTKTDKQGQHSYKRDVLGRFRRLIRIANGHAPQKQIDIFLTFFV